MGLVWNMMKPIIESNSKMIGIKHTHINIISVSSSVDRKMKVQKLKSINNSSHYHQMQNSRFLLFVLVVCFLLL